MKFNYSEFFQIKLLLISLIINFSNLQTEEDLLIPKCVGRNIKYSIIGNLEEYLQFQNNIDGREMFNSLEIFKSKKLGTISRTYYNKIKFSNCKRI